MLEKLQERILEITKSIENLVTQHNFLTGALQEANKAVQLYVEHRDELAKIIDEAKQNPVEAAIDSVELINEVTGN